MSAPYDESLVEAGRRDSFRQSHAAHTDLTTMPMSQKASINDFCSIHPFPPNRGLIMAAYETRLTIEDPDRLELRNLPFKPGQHVKVIVLEEDEIEQRMHRWRELFRRTQALPEAQSLTEADIAGEIKAYREGR